jgi:hypothetical protein
MRMKWKKEKEGQKLMENRDKNRDWPANAVPEVIVKGEMATARLP